MCTGQFRINPRLGFIALLALMAGGFYIPSQVQQVHATPPPLALDGVGVNTCSGQYCAHSQVLTTAHGHDVIVVVAETVAGANITSVTDTRGLNFTLRLSFNSNPYCFTCGGVVQTLWEYYAVAPSPLNSDNITVNIKPGLPPWDECCFVWGMQTIAIHGPNTRVVFDPDSSIPSACAQPACGNCYAYGDTSTCSALIQTSTYDFVIAAIAINDAGPCGSGYPLGIVPGFTSLTVQNNRFEMDYAITTRPRNTVVASCAGTDAVAMTLDAISFYGAFGT